MLSQITNNPFVKTVIGLLVIAFGAFVTGAFLYGVGLDGVASVTGYVVTISLAFAVLLAVLVTPFLIGSLLLHHS